MAFARKTRSGKWQFQVTHNYKTKSKTFKTKLEGYEWEKKIKSGEISIDGNSANPVTMTLGELLEKYRREKSKDKRGARRESMFIDKFQRNKIADIKLSELNKKHIIEWRDDSLKVVSALTVHREWAVLSHCLNIAKKEWDLIDANPMENVEKPKKPPARTRLPSERELELLCYALNYNEDDESLKMVTSRVGAALMFAVATGMRASEITGLKWSNINGKVAKIENAKTYAGIREVALFPDALKIIEQCKGIDDEKIFGITAAQIDSNFRNAKKKTGITELHFHDSRALAITQLAKKLDILDLARMVGHSDLKKLMIYYRKTMAEIAES